MKDTILRMLGYGSAILICMFCLYLIIGEPLP